MPCSIDVPEQVRPLECEFGRERGSVSAGSFHGRDEIWKPGQWRSDRDTRRVGRFDGRQNPPAVLFLNSRFGDHEIEQTVVSREPNSSGEKVLSRNRIRLLSLRKCELSTDRGAPVETLLRTVWETADVLEKSGVDTPYKFGAITRRAHLRAPAGRPRRTLRV